MSSSLRSKPVLGLVFLLSFLGVAGSMAIPRFNGEARGHGSAAISSLQVIAEAQRNFREAVRVDQDGDGVGEAGFYFELAGFPSLRPTPDQMRKPLLSLGFRPGPPEFVARSGYRFLMLLPGAAGGWVSSPSDPVDANRAENEFVVLAWPEAPLKHEDRVFAALADGRLFIAHDPGQTWVGNRKPPLPREVGAGTTASPELDWTVSSEIRTELDSK